MRVPSKFFGQKFQSNEAVEPNVFCLIDDTHSAHAKLFDDAIVRNSSTDHRRGNLGCNGRDGEEEKSTRQTYTLGLPFSTESARQFIFAAPSLDSHARRLIPCG